MKCASCRLIEDYILFCKPAKASIGIYTTNPMFRILVGEYHLEYIGEDLWRYVGSNHVVILSSEKLDTLSYIVSVEACKHPLNDKYYLKKLYAYAVLFSPADTNTREKFLSRAGIDNVRLTILEVLKNEKDFVEIIDSDEDDSEHLRKALSSAPDSAFRELIKVAADYDMKEVLEVLLKRFDRKISQIFKSNPTLKKEVFAGLL